MTPSMAKDRAPASPEGRAKRLYDPASTEPFALSRTKIELFLRCARCFYLDRRLGIAQPQGPPFTLNSAVDALLKKEFDLFRAQGKPHGMMTRFGVDAIPLRHPMLDDWRDPFRGIRHLHTPTNFQVFGALDDVWADPAGRLIVVDYKATSSALAVTLEGRWKESYKRQVEVYQWLLRRNGFTVSDTAYFVYVNADKERPAFDGKLEFVTTVLPHQGKDSWIEDALVEAKTCLSRDSMPQPHGECEWCAYRKAAAVAEVFSS